MNQPLFSPLRILVGSLALGFFGYGLSGCSSKPEEVALATPANGSSDGEPMEVIDESGNEAISVEDEDTSADPGPADPNVVADETEDTSEDPPEMADEDAGQEAMSASGEDAAPSVANAPNGANDPNQSQAASAEPAKPKTLREQAEIAFSEGFDRTAVRLLQAHALAVPSEAAAVLNNYRWSMARLQPELLSRIAVGVDLKNEFASVTKDKFAPIGSIRMRSSRGGDGGEDTFDDEGSGSSAALLKSTSARHRILQKYTGLMGDGLVDHVRRAHAEGKWSPAFQNNKGIESQGSAAAPEMDVVEAEPETSDEDEGSSAALPTPPPSIASNTTTKPDSLESKYISLGPAMSFIGVNKTPELIERAKKGQFAALVVYDVEITINRKLRIIYNECKARLVNLSDGKVLAATKLLKNTDAAREMAKSGGSLIDKTMQPLNDAIDTKAALIAMPSQLTSTTIVSKRLPMLYADKVRSKLDILAELRLYHEMKLLTDSELGAAYTTIIGAEDGSKLLAGTDEERREIVDKLLVTASE